MIAPIRDAQVSIETSSDQPSRAVVKFSGTLSHREPAPLLKPFFEQLHALLLQKGMREAHVDLRELKFMNSSSFKHFIGWVKVNGGQDPGARYKIIFLLNPAHHWQKVSIHALSCFSQDAIEARSA